MTVLLFLVLLLQLLLLAVAVVFLAAPAVKISADSMGCSLYY